MPDYRMTISDTLREQAEMVINVLVNEAVSFIESQELGSFLPIGALNRAMAGVGAMLNLKAVQERMVERNCSRGIFIIKGQGGNPAGLLIISAHAQTTVQNIFKGGRDSRPPAPPAPRQTNGNPTPLSLALRQGHADR